MDLAAHLRAATSLNLKPARMGGIIQARLALDLARLHGIDAWVGGMIETGIGRAVSIALAAQEGITAPNDISASDRHFGLDITEPFEVDSSGKMALPAGSGIGTAPLDSILAAHTRRHKVVWSWV